MYLESYDPDIHPLPIGTRVLYSDYSPWEEAFIVNNDPNSELFKTVCQIWAKKNNTSCPPEHMDYLVIFPKDEHSPIELLPVQRGGVRVRRQ